MCQESVSLSLQPERKRHHQHLLPASSICDFSLSSRPSFFLFISFYCHYNLYALDDFYVSSSYCVSPFRFGFVNVILLSFYRSISLVYCVCCGLSFTGSNQHNEKWSKTRIYIRYIYVYIFFLSLVPSDFLHSKCLYLYVDEPNDHLSRSSLSSSFSMLRPLLEYESIKKGGETTQWKNSTERRTRRRKKNAEPI